MDGTEEQRAFTEFIKERRIEFVPHIDNPHESDEHWQSINKIHKEESLKEILEVVLENPPTEPVIAILYSISYATNVSTCIITMV